MRGLKIITAQTYARIGGICYLLIILLGIFGQIVVRGSLLDAGDAEASVANIQASPMLWRLGILGDIAMHLLDIPLMIILYLLLSPVHKPIALIGLAFNLIQTAVLAVNKLTLMLPLILLGNQEYMASVPQAQVYAQILLLTDIHNYGFALGLIFFGFACLCYGFLIFKSTYFPAAIGVFIVLAGLCYLINSYVLLIVPAISPYVFPLLGVCLVAELSFCLWLLFKGVNFSGWQRTHEQPIGNESI